MVKQIGKRVLSMLMTLSILVSLLPALTLPAKAADYATFDFESNTDPVSGASTSVTMATQSVDGETILIESTGGGTFVVGAEWDVLGGWYDAFDGNCVCADIGSDASTTVRISLQSGKSFNLNTFSIFDMYNNPDAPAIITMTSSSNETYVVSDEIDYANHSGADHGEAAIDVSALPGFKDITYVEFSTDGDGLLLAFDDIYLTNIRAVGSPTVTTQAVTDITRTAATGNGNITDLGTTNPTQYGVCWSTSENPTTADSKTELGETDQTGAFSSSITGLAKNTTYHVRAYATNEQDTCYGDNVTFTTLADPAISSATYDASAGVIAVTGSNMTPGDTIVVSNLTLTGEGGGTYTLTSANVTADSATSFLVMLNPSDWLHVNGLLNKNGTASAGGTSYNLAGAIGWNATQSAPADTTNGITVSNLSAPTITSATYNAANGLLTVTGANLVKQAGASNDIDVTKLTITGQGGSYTLTDNTSNVEITSGTSFSVTLGATDKAQINSLLNNNGSSSTGGTVYNLAAADNWNGPITGGDISDSAGNGITVSGVNAAPVLSASGSAPSFIEGGSPVAIDSGITVTDSDNATLASATVTISVDFQPAEDVLGFTNDGSFGNISGSYSSGTGILTLTSAGATATVLQWQSALRAVTYANSSQDPTATSRAISFVVNDGTDNSNTATKTVSVTSVNDAPTDITLTGNSVNQSGGVNAVIGTLSTADVDSGQTHIYTKATGDGTNDRDNDLFNISGAILRANNAASMAAGTYNVYIRTTDNGAGNLTYDRAFTITVTDDLAPAVTSVAVPANITYGAGQNLDFTVNFTEAVTVDTLGGTPRIALIIGATTRYATYHSSSGTSALVFRYTVQAGDNDSNGVTVVALSANGGTMRDSSGNNANLTLNSIGSTTNVLVDTTSPAVSSIVRQTPSNSLTNAASVIFRVTFNESVTGVDISDFALTKTGDADGTVDLVSPVSGTIYDVTVNTISGDGTLRLDLSGTGIEDAGGNAIAGGYSTGETYSIDNTAPTATISMSQTALYSGETATVTITFSEAVTGFTNDDLTISNGTLTAVSSADGGITWTATFTAANVDSATNAIILDLTGITDTAGNTGSGTASSGNYTVSMPIAPGAPTIGTATAGDTQATVTFTAPASNGGSAITGYTVTVSPAHVPPVSGAASPITVTGLTNGVAYTFTVTATNGVGTGTASAASNSVTPRATQTITFDNPGAQNFGTSPTLTATSDSGLPVTFTSQTTGVCTVTSGGVLTFITAGTATITAHQAGDASYLPAESVSRSFTVNPVVPGAPTGVTAIEGDTQASVSFTAPVSTGGTSITGYTVTVSPAHVAPVNGASSPIVVTGLTNGQAYTFTVTATNSAGTGAASAASNSVTPRATQTITFDNPGAQNFGTSPTLTATSDSGLPVTFTSQTTGVCTVTSGGVLTFITAGTATITAHQAGDASYLPATSVQRSFTVNPVAPGAPTGVTATAGDTQASVSFSTPVSTGGVAITGYTVTANPGGFTATGAGSPIVVTGLTNGQAYTFTVTATNSAGTGTASAASNSVTPQAPVYDDTPSTPTTPPSNNAVVEVNGARQDAGTSATTTTDGQTVTKITVDDTKLNKILESSGEKPTVTLPSAGSAVTVGVLTGQTIKNMENKEATLQIKTDTVTYTLPASQISIDAVSALLGSQVELKDIKVSVKIAEPPTDMVKIVEDTASKGGYQLVVAPVEFEITCTSGAQTVEVSRFNGYVERTIAIPDGIDPSKITTGIVLNSDGTFSHVPTQIVVIGGKYYAKINSLTNSVYSVIYNPMTFTDMANHWAKDAVNDMGSRMVVTGIGNGIYEPSRSITRAEFAAIVVRALGLQNGTTESAFSDVTVTHWFNGYVHTATAYSLITGYNSENFAPSDTITREQAMTILARAMKLTGLIVNLTDSEASALLANYSDAGLVSDYAKTGAAACIKTGVVSGTTASTLSPKDSVTRAEVATMVQRLLQKSGLI